MPKYRKAIFYDVPLKHEGKEIAVEIAVAVTFDVDEAVDAVSVSKVALDYFEELLRGKANVVEFGPLERCD
jgi:hypothetical protein